MTFTEIREHLYARARFGVRPGLETTRLILDRLGNPEARYPVVHVAGTNGKGSTAAFLTAILAEGGYRTGLFTSPHLISYTERFRINGNDITEEFLVPLAERVLAVAPEEATFFELTTAIAFLYFAEEQVDLAVMEAGMGGRLDATNVANGILSVITPISRDHCAYLGESIREIATEKAGIITGHGPVVCSPQPGDALEVIEDRSAAYAAPLYRCGREFRAEWRHDSLDYHGVSCSLDGLSLGIPGSYQRDNAAAALAAAELLGGLDFPLTLCHMRRGIESASWPGRMELFPGPPRLLLDGAHNPAGISALVSALEQIERVRLILIAGLMADKDCSGVIDPLLTLADEVITVNASLPRAVPAVELATYCTSRGSNAVAAGSVAQGLVSAMQRAGRDDLILLTGSLYLVGEARSLLLARTSHPYQG